MKNENLQFYITLITTSGLEDTSKKLYLYYNFINVFVEIEMSLKI